MRQELLIFAGILLGVIGAMHSYLGERYVIKRLFALSDLPLLRRDRRYTERVLRFAWHLTSVAWWGFGALLFVLALAPNDAAFAGVIAAILLVNGTLVLAAGGARHPAWPLFLLAGGAVLYAAW